MDTSCGLNQAGCKWVAATSNTAASSGVGAKRSFVLAQFLTEAVALCIIGALLALLAVGLLVVTINAFSDGLSLVFGPKRFLLGLGIAVVSGVIAGLAPALQAARMDPVEAMRAACTSEGETEADGHIISVEGNGRRGLLPHARQVER